MKKLKAVTTALLLIGLVSLGGCSGNSAEVLPSPEPTTTMKVVETPSPTPTAVVEPTQTPIPTPTATVEPSATVEPTKAPVDEVKPSEKPVEATTSTKSQHVEQSKAPASVDTSKFVYPENSTTEGLTPSEIAKGFYIRTDKNNKVYNQEGQYQGFKQGTSEEVHPDLSGETDKALYGGETDTSMLDTSGAVHSSNSSSSSGFVYPENSTTEGLRPQDVAKGWYVDKTDNAILDQDGGFHGYSKPPEVVHPDSSKETADKLYGGETDTSMLDTSGAYQSEPTSSAEDEAAVTSDDELDNWGMDDPGPDDFMENSDHDFNITVE